MSRMIEITIYRDEGSYQANIPGIKRSYFTSLALFEDLKFLLSYSYNAVYVMKLKEDDRSVNGN